MRTLRILIVFAVFSACEGADAFDLEMTIRAQLRQFTFGDPLYIEVTIVNRGQTTVTGPPPSTYLSTFGFRVYNSTSHLEFRHLGGGGFVGGGPPVEFEPDIPVIYYHRLYLPGLPLRDHPFWKSVQGERPLDIYAVYYLTREVALVSNTLDIVVQERDEREMRVLEKWALADVKTSGKGPTPNDFGIQFYRPLDRAQTADIASQISGELQNLLHLTLRFQDLFALRPQTNERIDRELVKWLERQPDIKRQFLIKEARGRAEAYNLRSTMQAIQRLADSP
jgi:hypothetical protein